MLRRNFSSARSRKKSDKGFTLLLAALVSSIVLALGVAIFGIAQKQLTLSSMGRDSQFAFYTADTGAECALYWDVKHGLFGTSTPPYTQIYYQSGITAQDQTCDGQWLGITDWPQNYKPDHSYAINFQFNTGKSDLNPASIRCAQVSVKKCNGTFDTNGICQFASSNIETLIHSDGYSTDCDSIGTNPRVLQRSVELRY